MRSSKHCCGTVTPGTWVRVTSLIFSPRREATLPYPQVRTGCVGDSTELSQFYADDGSSIDVFGNEARGRDAIAELLRHTLQQMKDSQTHLDNIRVRPLAESLVFVDAEQSVAMPLNPAQDLLCHFSAVMRRSGTRDWRFVDTRAFVPIQRATAITQGHSIQRA